MANRYVLWLMILGLTLCKPTFGTDDMVLRGEAWEKCLPHIELKNVHISEKNLLDAWLTFSRKYFIRSNICYGESIGADGEPFTFDADRCRVRDYFDALATRYNYQWTIDPETHVIWLHQKDLAFDGILDQQIRVSRPQWGIQMLGGALEPLTMEFFSLDLWRFGFDSTYITYGDPVAIPAGVYTTRDILNYFCRWSLQTAFAVYQPDSIDQQINAVHYAYEAPRRPRPGGLAFWRAEVGACEGAAPSEKDVLAAFASPQASVRWAAWQFARAEYPDMVEYFRRALGRDKTRNSAADLWLTLALLGIPSWDIFFVKTTDNERKELVDECLRKIATPDFLRTCDEDLAALAAVELVRHCDDTAGLAVLAERGFRWENVKSIAPEIAYVVRHTYMPEGETFSSSAAKAGIPLSGWAKDGLVFDGDHPQHLQFQAAETGGWCCNRPLTREERWKKRLDQYKRERRSEGKKKGGGSSGTCPVVNH